MQDPQATAVPMVPGHTGASAARHAGRPAPKPDTDRATAGTIATTLKCRGPAITISIHVQVDIVAIAKY
jgi:hypothetical protein